MKTNIARNITVKIELTTFGGKKERFAGEEYIMAPDKSDDIWAEASQFNRGHRAVVQLIVNLGYWHFLKQNDCEQIEAHLLPDIAYKFDRKTKDAIVTLQDGNSLRIWIDVDISR